MSKMLMRENVLIDDVEFVLEQIRTMSPTKLTGLETVKRFVSEEANTMFYVDDKLKSKTEHDSNCTYLWLDTGYTDYDGNAILISLLRSNGIFTGHVTGTMAFLKSSAEDFFYRNKKDINKNYSRLVDKYNKKIADREHLHIIDEDAFLVNMSNPSDGVSEFARKLAGLNCVWAVDEEEPGVDEEELAVEEVEEPAEEETEPDLYTKMTVAMLCDEIEKIQAYVKTLEDTIVTLKSDRDAQVADLKQQNEEYKRALEGIRCFAQAEEEREQSRECQKPEHPVNAHKFLEKNNKILVLGDVSIGTNVMQAIAKREFGFAKDDFEFVTDYKRVVHCAGRIENADRYQAVIFGCVPHKVAKVDCWSSIVEQFKQSRRDVITVDARNKSGALKVTKNSFRKALQEICGAMDAMSKGICA